MNNSNERVLNLVRLVQVLINFESNKNVIDDKLIFENLDKATRNNDLIFSVEEIEAAKRELQSIFQIFTDPGYSIVDDYESNNWYDQVKEAIEPYFWNRYKNYLIDDKNFSPNVISTLSEETLDSMLMNYIAEPHIDNNLPPVLKRGLVIGDVQSGKTSTYIGFICKAADAGYKVFILLTGTIESLRKQTQERVEEGFIGIDMSAKMNEGQRVGVGLDNKPIKAIALTSRDSDFKGDSNKIAMALTDKNAVVFVIKKQKNVLEKLKNWLVSLNADARTGKIDLPMLMIDDEADNASINTNRDKENPTIINKLIRELANVFKVSNYVGFTATPFANVFIDPATPEKMEAEDLFPENFIVSLPTPSNYIGPDKIFNKSGDSVLHLNYICDAGLEESDGHSFYLSHDKYWDDELPSSVTDAIYTFYLANALRDLRGDTKEHRSMLINVSRFIDVQRNISKKIEEIHGKAYRSIKFNLSSNFEESMKDPNLKRLYENWEKQYPNKEFSWDLIVKTIFKSIESIQIKVVNSGRNSEKLTYTKNESLRVIVIGGLALSRGLTLEGLVVSYFFRNTSTYDVLMQMGRWFGYRKNYEDLFRIWTLKNSAKWYWEISDATRQLKHDMVQMRDEGKRPRDFGIRIRNNSDALRITASNKMRNTQMEVEYKSYLGGIIETPYLKLNSDVQKKNYYVFENLVGELLKDGYTLEREMKNNNEGKYIIRDISKKYLVNFIRQFDVSQYNNGFNTRNLLDFLVDNEIDSINHFDIGIMEGFKTEDSSLIIDLFGRKLSKVKRNNCIFDNGNQRISIGRKGKLGGPSDGLLGIVDVNGRSYIDIIDSAKAEYRKYNKEKADSKTTIRYPSDTWFKYVHERNPLLLVYPIDLGVDKEESNQLKQVDKFKEEMNGIPVLGLSLGFPNDKHARLISSDKYLVNKKYNFFELNFQKEDEEE